MLKMLLTLNADISIKIKNRLNFEKYEINSINCKYKHKEWLLMSVIKSL